MLQTWSLNPTYNNQAKVAQAMNNPKQYPLTRLLASWIENVRGSVYTGLDVMVK